MTPGHDSQPPTDPVFTGLFADGRPPAGADPDAGEVQRGVLRPYRPTDEAALAEQSSATALVVDALALAEWVGEGRAVTPDERLSEAEAREAATKIGLAGPDPAPEGLAPADLAELHVLWAATVEAGLISVDDAIARLGAGLAAWVDGTPEARLEGWARLLAGLLRARAALDEDGDGVGGLELASAPFYYSLARDPMPAAFPALVIATAADDEADLGWLVRRLPAAIDAIARDWAWAGALIPVEDLTAEDVEALDEMFESLTPDEEDDESALAAEQLRPLVESVQESPIVALTELGAYGLRRVLLAHGWQVPLAGAAADARADQLLDLLVAYLPEDARDETALWLQARGDKWRHGLAQVAQSARVKSPDLGAPRRAALAEMFLQVGPDVVEVLDTLTEDPWLSALAADVRFELELGPEPTLSQELWLIVDGLSTVLDAEDGEQAEAVEDSGVLEFLRLPGAVVAANTLTHPHSRYVLGMVVQVSGDEQLAHQLRTVLDPGPARAGKNQGRPKRRR